MFTMCNAALTHVEILRLRAATELNNYDQVRRRPLPNRTEFIIFFRKRLTMTPISVRLFFQQLTGSVMFFSV